MHRYFFALLTVIAIAGIAPAQEQQQEKPPEFEEGELDHYYAERIKLELETDKTEYNMGEAIVFTLKVTNISRKSLTLCEEWFQKGSISVCFANEGRGPFRELLKPLDVFGQAPAVLEPGKPVAHKFLFDNRLSQSAWECQRDYMLGKGWATVRIQVNAPGEKTALQEGKYLTSNSVSLTLKGHGSIREDADQYEIQTSHWAAQLEHDEKIVRDHARLWLLVFLGTCYNHLKNIANYKTETSITKSAKAFLEDLDIHEGITATLTPNPLNTKSGPLSMKLVNLSDHSVSILSAKHTKENSQCIVLTAVDSKGNLIELTNCTDNTSKPEEPKIKELSPGSAIYNACNPPGWRTKEGKPLAPGKYTVTATYTVPEEMAKEHEGLWTGSLKSNTIEVIIPEPEKKDKQNENEK